jgi:ubiquinone biosynthesis accessory factor UbiK
MFKVMILKNLQELKNDLQEELHRGAARAARQLDLVTREEFDIQAQVLARTRARLEQLEARVQALEKLD